MLLLLLFSIETMATSNHRTTKCSMCQEEKSLLKCLGCSEHFCYDHVIDHRRSIQQQFTQLEDQRNRFVDLINEQKLDFNKHFLIKQINLWEKNSIEKIRQTAEVQRQLLKDPIMKIINKLEIDLGKFADDLLEIKEKNDYNELILKQFREKFNELNKDFHEPSTVRIKENSSTTMFIKKISINFCSTQINMPNIPVDTRWKQNGITVAGGHGDDNGLDQLSLAYGLTVDDEQNIYIADTYNHRIVEWKRGATTGQIIAGGKGKGYQSNQLNYPHSVIIDRQTDSLIVADRGNRRVMQWARQNDGCGTTIISNVDCWGLALDKHGYLYVSDIDKHEIRRWKIGEREGLLVAGGNGKGNRLNQFNEPRYIFVDQNETIYVSDCKNHRIVKWMKGAREGIVLAGDQTSFSSGKSLKQLSYPHGLIVDQSGTIYVVDGKNDRIIRWLKDGKEGQMIIGEHGRGSEMKQLKNPRDLAFDQQNNLYVLDYDNQRVQKFLTEELT